MPTKMKVSIWEIASSPWACECLLAVFTAVIVVPCGWSTILISELSTKIILQPLDLQTSETANYSGVSRIRCAAIALQHPNSSFCYTSADGCVAVKAPGFPPGYNNGNGMFFHHCFTYAKALFDLEAALKNCEETGNCCPLPFQNITHLGCVYSPVFWWFPVMSHSMARTLCKGLWPTGDLYFKPQNWTALLSYISSRGLADVWVGATRVGTSSNFEWVDGTAVADKDFGSHMVSTGNMYQPRKDSQQPDGRNEFTYAGNIVDPNCLLVLKFAQKQGLGDDTCHKWTSYMCVIP